MLTFWVLLFRNKNQEGLHMRKTIKIATIFSTALLLAAGGAVTSHAAWEQAGGNWIFTDNSGNRVRNSWRQSGNYYYYLDQNGIMATNRWIDDTYYVDGNGVMVTDRWIYTEGNHYYGSYSNGRWYYLDANGRVVRDGWRTINNRRYHFDDDGAMQYGWFHEGDNLYYLGDWNDGAAKTGWLCLDYDDYDGQDDGEVSPVTGSGKWFYFQENGRAVKARDGRYADRNINGSRYYFDENGVMLTGWVSVTGRDTGDTTGISAYKYFGNENEGQMARGWRYLTEYPGDYEYRNGSRYGWGYDSGDGAWYYFDNSGVPAYLKAGTERLSDAVIRINGDRYFFDAYGRMQSGLLGLVYPDGTTVSAYFGANDSDGRMKTDRQTNVWEENGERSTFYFNPSGDRGAGYTGERSGYLYYMGKLVQAERGEDIQVFEVGGRLYLVNESGRSQDSNRVYRADGEYRYEYENGVIYTVNERRERTGQVTTGERLPGIAFRRIYSLQTAAE